MLTHPFLLLLLGGGLGANARYWLGLLMKSLGWTMQFPWHTFLINIVGSFILGIVMATCKDRPSWYLFLGVGICGGFTTFSTFSVELLELLEKDRILAALAYAGGSVLVALLGAWLGVKLGRT